MSIIIKKTNEIYKQTIDDKINGILKKISFIEIKHG